MISRISNYVLNTIARGHGASFLDKILDVQGGVNSPVVTFFGVDLLYPGLDLEIDAMAFKNNHQRMTLGPAG